MKINIAKELIRIADMIISDVNVTPPDDVANLMRDFHQSSPHSVDIREETVFFTYNLGVTLTDLLLSRLTKEGKDFYVYAENGSIMIVFMVKNK